MRTIELDTRELKYSEELLRRYKEAEIVDFDTDVWSFYSENFDENINYKFKCFDDEYKDKIKAFVLYSYEKGMSFKGLQYRLSTIRNIYHESDKFTNLQKETILVKKNEFDYATIFCSFAYFIGEFTDIADDISQYKHKEKEMRELPFINTYFKFDYIINDFLLNATDEELKFYYPIVLWFKLTSIIPMRPSEFTLIRNNPTVYDNGIWYIEIPCIKQRLTRTPEYSLMPIDDELNVLISNYLELCEDKKRNYLISVINYKKTFSKPRLDMKMVNYVDLRILLESFYNEIVSKKMGYKIIEHDSYDSRNINTIEQLKLGDLRPFAMYNLMAQGLDPYAIQRMARHTTINAQLAYYPNMMNMSLGRVHAMSERIKKRSATSLYFNSKAGSIMEDRKRLAQRLQVEKEDSIPMKDGRCCGKLKCAPGISCDVCPYYITDSNKNEKAILDNEIKELQECVDAMIAIHINRQGQYEKLSPLARQMDAHIRRAAIMEAKCG